MPESTPSRADLLSAAKSFCDCFAQKKPLDEILSHFAASPTESHEAQEKQEEILIHEHGLPQLAPFLGRDFRGLEGAKEYFGLLGKYLSYEDMRFVEFIVDAEGESGKEGKGGKVAVRGQARFTWTETNQSWDETFVYVLRFDDGCQLARYEVWADSGAAYLARRSELDGVGARVGNES
jgi:hypothetical protein